ncbi:MAG: glycosyltransferase, partial [Desulfovibrio sp.]|nr:glycosyltransferase [Desulfovibrio sp.]
MLSLVIPVYNEEGSLPLLFEAIAKLTTPYPDLEAIFVDDGSSDSSYA